MVSVSRVPATCCAQQIVDIEWLEATVLSIYLPEEKRTSIYARPTLIVSVVTCLAEPFGLSLYSCVSNEPASNNRNAACSQHYIRCGQSCFPTTAKLL